jgi:hypothetical protein
MKGGVNIWRALKENHSEHPAWRHLNGRAYTDDDMPRRVNEPKKAGAPAAAVPEGQMGQEKGAITDAIVEEGKEEMAELGVAAL